MCASVGKQVYAECHASGAIAQWGQRDEIKYIRVGANKMNKRAINA